MTRPPCEDCGATWPEEHARDCSATKKTLVAQAKATGWIRVDEMPACPYCGEPQADWQQRYGGRHAEDGERSWMDCAGCGQTFRIFLHIRYSFTSRRRGAGGAPQGEDRDDQGPEGCRAAGRPAANREG